MTAPDRNRARDGFVLGFAAYAMWGAFPLYWPLLEPAGAVELLAHRVAWSALVMAVLAVALRKREGLARVVRDRRVLLLLLAAACVISVNWGVYIWSVNHEHVVDASLGYFINPLVTVLMGVLVLDERLRTLQWAALAVAGGAVVWLTLAEGRAPYIALTLAFSFGTYGLLRKKADVGAVEGLTVETFLLAPLAVAYLVWLQASRDGRAFSEGPGHFGLLATAGLVTALPLLCFGGAATRVPLTTLGLLQYVAPTLQFVLGTTVGGESMSVSRWVGFAVIWAALVLFSLDSVRSRRQSRLVVEASAA
ncbi:EamA family transporter RarD [Nocardioides marmoribigeumensis]|uniref:Chloramphenicol-sensitive protein RarD n=1 Tax=Nocardioides marmoribigeumensis TaxID=433649 RepID=A0ABU2BSQ6_9ACTN|nr:EamA family transporter RarD [Nocardioides marmoribigeumensis]MDR7361673.1 chloramphenicol-sensitive protein RarD [Nocardioides marmoribigeumensis]